MLLEQFAPITYSEKVNQPLTESTAACIIALDLAPAEGLLGHSSVTLYFNPQLPRIWAFNLGQVIPGLAFFAETAAK
jgi:hypothetical protein